MARNITYKEVTITNGQQLSGAINVSEKALLGVYIPSGFTGTTLKLFAGSKENDNYVEVANVEYTVAASRYLPIDNLAITAGIEWLKLRSGSAESGDKKLKLAFGEVLG